MVAAHGAAVGRVPGQYRAGLGQKIIRRVFGTQTHLDGPAAAPREHRLLRQRQGLALGDAQLPFHQVQAINDFGDRVLHLQAGVHFQEIKASVLGQHELDRAGTHVIHCARRRHRRRAHAGAQGLVHRRAGRLFQHFLVAPLYRAVALADVQHRAMAVAKHLYFHMARLQHGFFDEQLTIAKRIGRLAAG